MDGLLSPPTESEDHLLLRLRNSISTPTEVTPPKLALPELDSSSAASTVASSAATSSFSSFPSDDIELLSAKPSCYHHTYTSLKDVLPSSSIGVNSPQPKSAQPGSDICIRNRLVKQAAWAYLQPMSISPSSPCGNLFNRLWTRVATFIEFIGRCLIQALNGSLQIIRIRSSR